MLNDVGMFCVCAASALLCVYVYKLQRKLRIDNSRPMLCLQISVLYSHSKLCLQWSGFIIDGMYKVFIVYSLAKEKYEQQFLLHYLTILLEVPEMEFLF